MIEGPPYLDNPAGRLRAAVLLARRVPSETLAKDGWAKVFTLDSEDWLGVLTSGTRLGDQAAQAKRLANELGLPEHKTRHWGYVTSVVRRFASMENVRMGDFLAPWSDVVDLMVEDLDYELHTRAPEPTLPSAKGEELRAAVDDLLSRLIAGDLAEELSQETRDFVIDHLTLIRERLGWVPLVGPRPFRQAVDGLVGNIQREPSMWQRVMESAAGQIIGSLIVALLLAAPGDYEAPVIESPDLTVINTTVVNVIPGSVVRDPALTFIEETLGIAPQPHAPEGPPVEKGAHAVGDEAN